MIIFKVEQIKPDYYIIAVSYSDMPQRYEFIINIADSICITTKALKDAVKLYNGFCLGWTIDCIDTKSVNPDYSRICFSDKNDAEIFITDYLEPQLLIKKLL